MVPSHRRALRARLLSFRYLLRISFSTRRLVVQGTKSWPGGPRPTLRRKYEMEPLWFLLIAGRFARGCSLSDIYYGLVSPRDAWWCRGQSHGRGGPGQPCGASGTKVEFDGGPLLR